MKEKVISILNDLNIKYKVYEHENIFNCEQSDKIFWHIQNWRSKNLFLTDKKNEKFYLISIDSKKKINLKKFWAYENIKWLTFANQDFLKQYLWVLPWSVSPFWLINDCSKKVKYFIDLDLINSNTVLFHPNDNWFTLELDKNEFLKFLIFFGINFSIISIDEK